MKTIDPDMQQLPAILAGIPQGTPVIMLNLLRFKPTAVYKGEAAEYSGREAYRLYSEVALKEVAKIGGEVVYVGAAKGALIGPAEEQWDEVLLVRYPSIEAFMSMLASPEYRACTKHRTAALDDARLVATLPQKTL